MKEQTALPEEFHNTDFVWLSDDKKTLTVYGCREDAEIDILSLLLFLNAQVGLPYNYQDINTSLASEEILSDRQLIEQIRNMAWCHSHFTGYGLIAELCKRFESRIND